MVWKLKIYLEKNRNNISQNLKETEQIADKAVELIFNNVYDDNLIFIENKC